MSSSIEPRHEFYETDEKVLISIFDRGAAPERVSVHFSSRSLSYEHGEKKLVLEPLTGEIHVDACDFTVGKVKVEVRLVKRAPGRWKKLVGESVDPTTTAVTSSSQPRAKRKDWDGIVDQAIMAEPEKKTAEDPNAGGDAALNDFFQKLYTDADDDTKRAMMKSFQESGGTALSTNWAEVGQGRVGVKPP